MEGIVDPVREPKAVDSATEQSHRFRWCGERTLLRLCLKDEKRECMANRAYTLTIDGREVQGTTSAEGYLEEPVPADARDAVLQITIGEDDTDTRVVLKLGIGELDPEDRMEGIQSRLNNLGYPCGDPDGNCGPLTEAAVRRFQEDNGLTVDGIPGPQTQGKLKELHGC